MAPNKNEQNEQIKQRGPWQLSPIFGPAEPEDLSCLSKNNKGCPSFGPEMDVETNGEVKPRRNPNCGGFISGFARQRPSSVCWFLGLLGRFASPPRVSNPRLLDAYDCLASADGRPDETIFGRKVLMP